MTKTFYEPAEPVDYNLVIGAIYKCLTKHVKTNLREAAEVRLPNGKIDFVKSIERLCENHPKLLNNNYYKIRDYFERLWGIRSRDLSERLFGNDRHRKTVTIDPHLLVTSIFELRARLLVPARGSRWRYLRNNNVYEVYDRTNEASTVKDYPLQISFVNVHNQRRYSKPFDQWGEKYAPAEEKA